MSSIYKKGRDGYYYYQAYVSNPKTKKKNKRIFHSLGTKNSLEAKEKQKKLDLKYENMNLSKNYFSWILQNFKQISFLTLITIFITVFIVFTYEIKLIQEKTKDIPSSLNSLSTVEKDKKETFVSELQYLNKENTVLSLQINNDSQKFISDLNGNATFEPKIPKYNIERIEKSSGPFNQGKFYVIIDESVDIDSQRLLCDKIAEENQQFSNILICLYANNKIGKIMASGKNININVEDKKKSWLAMYTYNSVEGEYFNDNPTEYLRGY